MLMASSALGAGEAKVEHTYELDRAKYFLNKDPDRALQIIKQVKPDKQTDKAQYVKKHLLEATALMLLRKNDFAQQPVTLLFELSQTSEFRDELFQITFLSSTLLRRSNRFEEATQAYNCALKHSTNLKQQLRVLNGQANTLRERGKYFKAGVIYRQAITVAEQIPDNIAMASIYNNLGVLYLDAKDLEKAKSALKRAFELLQLTATKSAVLDSGLNLLFVAVLSKDEALYQRLNHRLQQLTENYSNESRTAYFEWIKAGYAFTQENNINEHEKTKLAASFLKIDDLGLKRLLKTHLAIPMNVRLDASAFKQNAFSLGSSEAAPVWVKKLLTCNW
ncbi:tetratricopeptide repeat protein [Pseudoalteromonas piscicida]|nr:tetratricopeptide repeat protein [Pseudoalteromonas piscicida]